MTLLATEAGSKQQTASSPFEGRTGANLCLLRIMCWCVVLCLGAAEAWATRSTMFPDGVSYLDIGDAYWRGDWHNAINAYWSPFYPWITGLFLKIFKPSPDWEFALVHVINFLIYVVALICFDFLLRTFMDGESVRSRSSVSEVALPAWAWQVAGYSAFVISSLFLVTISFVSGDMLVAAVIFLVAALLLRVQGGTWTWRAFALLGFLLGVGYLCKTVMFLMSLPFMAAAAATQNGRKRQLRSAGVSLLFFFLVCAPLVIALSKEKGRLTFGDSGKINYAMNVGTTQFFTPHESDAKHPVRKLAALAEAYEYGSPIAGTYPLWYDPSYWHEGITPRYNLWRQVRTLLLALAECAWISFNVRMGLVISTVIAFLYLVSTSMRESLKRAASNWVLWVPAIAGIGLYSLVVIEPRYIAALFCILWIVALSSVRLPATRDSRLLMTGAVIVLASLTCAGVAWQISRALDTADVAQRGIATPVCATVAEALIADGIQPGDKLAVISDWLFPSRQGAYIARLARARIIGEARPEFFWSADIAKQNKLISDFVQAGANAILAYKPPHVGAGWKRLAGTDYYVSFPDANLKANVTEDTCSPCL